jgi:hypothetical protein
MVHKIRSGLNTYRLSQNQSSAATLECLSFCYNILFLVCNFRKRGLAKSPVMYIRPQRKDLITNVMLCSVFSMVTRNGDFETCIFNDCE